MPKRRAARKPIAEIEKRASGFERSELTKASYAELHGIRVAALDGYRHRSPRKEFTQELIALRART